MKANPWKIHVLLNSNIERLVPFANVQVTPSLSKNLVGIALDSRLKFEDHISKTCNINKKLNAVHRIVNHMSLSKRKTF